jgi:large subunit ribosomal protein L1
LEQEQKEEQKKRSMEKKMDKQKEDDELRETDEAIEPKKKAKKTKKEEIEEVKPKHKRGKKYMESAKKVDSKKAYTLDEAVSHLKKMKYAKFEESVELHLNVDTTGLKGEVDLPFSTGKTVRVVIVDDKIIEDIEGGKIEFDILVAHPSFMPKLAKFAKVLGPKGLMPNPKLGTVTNNVAEAIKALKGGQIEYKTEKTGIVHAGVGKMSFSPKAISENIKAFAGAVLRAKPSGAKGVYVRGITVSSTMGPGLKIDLSALS